MKRVSAFVATAMLALCFGAGQALAMEGAPSADQAAGQSADSGQAADGYGGAYQAGASNSAGSIRVLSPGDNGAVSQSNSATALSVAANANKTNQDVDQSQGGGVGGEYAQIAGQSAANKQRADADATAVQIKPQNTASSIRVLSPGDNGDVTQSNSAGAGALALNGNTTSQDTDQTQAGGGGYGSDSTQIAGQSADNKQSADADATALQVEPQNTASSIRVLSPGDDGDVTQSNDATAIGIAANGNATSQSLGQSQGAAAPARTAMDAKEKSVYPARSSSTQIAGQSASNAQWADADATAVQVKPKNTASSIRVLSPGDDGDVTQSNSTTAVAAGLNGNATRQSLEQSQGAAALPTRTTNVHPSGSSSTQIAGQSASNVQSADADATAVQVKPKNTASSIRVLSPGDDGDVTQSNDATAVGIAANRNGTSQSIAQSQGGGYGSDSLQVAGQGAWSGQGAAADATAVQLGAKNEYAPVRVASPNGKGKDSKHKGDKGEKRDMPDGGSVEQSNRVGALAFALNLNETCQSLLQRQTGSSSSLQVGGQGSWSAQGASADAFGLQGVMPRKK